jgi:mannose-1-phosphate guanylyltransferase
MFEECAYGWSRILDYAKLGGDEIITKRIHIKRNNYLNHECHQKRSETWKMISGEAHLYLDWEKRLIKAGDAVDIPSGTFHGLRALTDVDMIEIQMGKEISDEDRMTLTVDW